MRITIAAVGRAKRGPERALCDAYLSRISAAALGEVTVREVEERRPLSAGEMRQREAELLAGALPDGARLIALDAGGKSLSSEAFAARLRRLREEGAPELAFVIGGAEGLAPALLERAELVLSLGPMIWPHLLARAMLAEQLYRAQAILTGHPYHRA